MAVESFGVVLHWNGNAIAEVISASGPGGAATVGDISHLGSTAVEKMVFIPDEGQLTLEVNWYDGDTAQDALKADRASRTKRTVNLFLTDGSGTILTFNAYCMTFAMSAGVGQQVKGSITLEIDGVVTYSPRLVSDTLYSAGTIVLDLEEDTFAAAGASQNNANWSFGYGGSGLVINTVRRDSDTQVTIEYTTAADLCGTWTLTIQALAAALTGSYPSGVYSESIVIESTPSASPSGSPSTSPSEGTPSTSPSEGTPSSSPSDSPSEGTPSGSPSGSPSTSPSSSPSEGTPSGSPSSSPSHSPSPSPSTSPSGSPSEGTPSGSPSGSPS